MEFSIEREDGILLDVVKDEADVVGISLGSERSSYHYHSIYLNKKEMFGLITELVKMYGTMVEED